jgi:hypothetical protein
MAWENTVTEKEMDDTSLQYVQALRKDLKDVEPDLAVDGLSESILSWILGILRLRRF